MQDLRNLKVWHKAHELTLAVYREAELSNGPREVKRMLTALIIRLKQQAPDDGASHLTAHG